MRDIGKNAKARPGFGCMKAIALAVALVVSAPAFADDNKPAISSITETANAVTIHGTGFIQRRGQLQVMLSGFPSPLMVSSYTDTQIVAFLPAGVSDGTYVLSLVKSKRDGGDDNSNGDDFFFTLGAQGLKGDKGDKGDAGPPGPTGQTGLKGDAGTPGPQGAAGAPGANGKDGKDGNPGATGEQGPQGPAGPEGPQGPAGAIDPSKVIANQASPQVADFNITGSGTAGSLSAGSMNVSGDLAVGGALRPTYDSGWFLVKSDPGAATPPRNGNGEIGLATGLGGAPGRLMLYECGALDGSGNCATRIVVAGTGGYHDGSVQVNPISITSDGANGNIFISTIFSWWAWGYWTPAHGWGCEGHDCFTAYYRVLAWR